GRGRRPRDAGGAGDRRLRRELAAEHLDDDLSGPVAARPGRSLRGRRAVLSRRHRRQHAEALVPRRPNVAAPAGGDVRDSSSSAAAEGRAGSMSTAASPQGSIIYLEDVTVDFDGFKALHALNFYMDYRELRVVIGPNGAGKTTLLDVISGKVQPAYGRGSFGKPRELVGLRENEIAALGIGRKFQTPSIFANLTVRENLELSLARPSKGVFATLTARLEPSQRDRIDATLGTIGLADHAEVRAGGLSHGEKQWLEIGMVLVQDSERLLVDEPVAGMTDEETEKTGRLLQAVAEERSVLVIEHDMEFVRNIARKVTVLHEGQVLCEGPVDQVQKDERVMEVYLGRSRDAHA